MAYNASYDAEDVSEVVIDGVAKFGIAILAFVSLIVLAVLYVWMRKRVPGMK